MTLRAEVKVLRSIGQHPLHVSETKDWAISTFERKIKNVEREIHSDYNGYVTNQIPNHLPFFTGGPIPVYTSYFNGCPNNLAYWVVRTYESD